MSWAGCQNNPINLNFHLQKRLEIFEKNSADKIWSNKDIQVKVPCPVPDRVNTQMLLYLYIDIHIWGKFVFLAENTFIVEVKFELQYLLSFFWNLKFRRVLNHHPCCLLDLTTVFSLG